MATGAAYGGTGSAFTGTYSNASLACVENGHTVTNGSLSGTIDGGGVLGPTVVFQLDTLADFNTGNISGNSMSGTAILSVNLGAPTGVVMLTGTFAATKSH